MKPAIQTKFIVVTGGVLSGLGKGITTASIGSLFIKKYKVVPVKCEGYLNVDPGTMNPLEHGEVFVLDDKEEADMDFGHYERFLNINCKAHWNITMGKVYEEVRNKERRGDYLGKTVQMIPHVTNAIKDKWFRIAREEDADILMIEIGGTIGDIETEMHVEAARQLKRDVGPENVAYVHLTYVPLPKNVNEQKSKPTQQSVSLLRERGIQPDLIVARCEEPVEDKIREKISTFCDVPPEAVISGEDVEDLYEVPSLYRKQGVLDILCKRLGLAIPEENQKKTLTHKDKEITIGICGKYTKLHDSYASISHALQHGGRVMGVKVNMKWLETSKEENMEEFMQGVDGVIVPGGFGSRGVEGKIRVIQYCRENQVPFLGICYGMQLAVVEFARNVCGLEKANSTEVDPQTKYPIVDLLPEQLHVQYKGASMRLGGHTVHIKSGSLAHNLLGDSEVVRRFRHRYEVNPKFISVLEEKGLLFSGYTPDHSIMQVMELPGHPFFIGGQFHPELTSRMDRPDEFFLGLIKACASHPEASLALKLEGKAKSALIIPE